jgi:hypothetical protein
MGRRIIWAVMVAFAVVATATRPTLAIEAAECSGYANPICSVEESVSCSLLGSCFFGVHPIPCCWLWEVDTDYTYYEWAK